MAVQDTTKDTATATKTDVLDNTAAAGNPRRPRDGDKDEAELLIDDLHFLASKKATQEEFLHTFDALLADGRQMVLTCDCHPRLADDFSPKLTDRPPGGAVRSRAPPARRRRPARPDTPAGRVGGVR